MKNLKLMVLVAAFAMGPLPHVQPAPVGDQTPVFTVAYPTANADDDDGGGDDDGDDGGGGGAGAGAGPSFNNTNNGTPFWKSKKKVRVFKKKSRFKPKKTRVKAKARPRTLKARATTRLPMASDTDIIARNLSDTQVISIETLGFGVLERRPQANGLNLLRIKPRKGQTLRAARSEIRSITGIATADFNHYYRLNASETCTGSTCSPLQLIGWASNTSVTCQPDAFAVIDSHVDMNHPAFANSTITTLNLVATPLKPLQDGHGTAVAALLAADGSEFKGAFPGADFLAINIFHQGPKGDRRADAYSLISAIEEVRLRGIKIANFSLSGPDNSALRQAVDEAVQDRLHIIAAAGNAGPAAPALFPAGYEGVFAVAALDNNLRPYRRSSRGAHIDFAAPGVNLLSVGKARKLARHTGTSFSAPFVTAAILAVVSGKADPKPDATAATLSQLARDLGAQGRDDIYGAGLVQAPPLCAR